MQQKKMLMCSVYIVVSYTQQIQVQLVKIICISYLVMLKIGKIMFMITVKNKLPIILNVNCKCYVIMCIVNVFMNYW